MANNDTIQFTDDDKTLALVQIQAAARIASLEAALAQYADRGNWIEGEGGYEGTALCLIGPDVADAALKGGSDE